MFHTYFLEINRVRVLESQHEGRSRGKGTISEKSIIVTFKYIVEVPRLWHKCIYILPIQQDGKIIYQNSGVCFGAHDKNSCYAWSKSKKIKYAYIPISCTLNLYTKI